MSKPRVVAIIVAAAVAVVVVVMFVEGPFAGDDDGPQIVRTDADK